MASFFKKALGVFVEFDEENNAENSRVNTPKTGVPHEVNFNPVNHEEAIKFEKYFDALFEKTNLPGPDYFEFYKTMETLEVHIPNETARLAATFSSLSIQGLTKETLIETAKKYMVVLEADKVEFQKALSSKIKTEVIQRQSSLADLEKLIVSHSEKIQQLTKEITEAQIKIGKLKTEVLEEENKLAKNNNGYLIANQAILSKISSDIQKIQSTL